MGTREKDANLTRIRKIQILSIAVITISIFYIGQALMRGYTIGIINKILNKKESTEDIFIKKNKKEIKSKIIGEDDVIKLNIHKTEFINIDNTRNKESGDVRVWEFDDLQPTQRVKGYVFMKIKKFLVLYSYDLKVFKVYIYRQFISNISEPEFGFKDENARSIFLKFLKSLSDAENNGFGKILIESNFLYFCSKTEKNPTFLEEENPAQYMKNLINMFPISSNTT